jgi:putative addiction module component (TIGR02574 family)
VSIPLDELKQEAAKLSDAERAELALMLIESLEAPSVEEVDIEQAWQIEVERRAAQVDRGEAQPVPGDEVLARLRRKLE